jgi:hypothetical protein
MAHSPTVVSDVDGVTAVDEGEWGPAARDGFGVIACVDTVSEVE